LIEGLAEHYSAFRVTERLFLTGHSHQAWPDVAQEGQVEAWRDAAEHADLKWERAFAKAERLRVGVRSLLADPDAPVALAPNTHELVLRFLSALPLRERPKLVTTDGEFHTLRRQVGRLSEEGFEVVRLPARPVETLAERLAAEAGGASAVLVSAVLFEDSRIAPELPSLAEACADTGAELLVDAYHALGCVSFTIAGLERAWIVGGGYKYLQLGEGNCFLRLPPQAEELRPAITGWFAEFEELQAAHEPGATPYPRGSMRFAGSTYDPTSHYRAARVLDFFEKHGLTPERLRESYLQQTTVLAERFDELGLEDVTRDRETPLEAFGGFLALESERAEELSRRLLDAGVVTDSRGRYLRLGPAPYHSDEQLEAAVEELGRAAMRRSG
jgi:kynureninase